MKKLLSLALAAAMALTLAACGGGSSSSSAPTSAPASSAAASSEPAASTAAAKRVAVVQWVEHASLDMICGAVTDELEALGLDYTVFNCNADAGQTEQIAAQVMSDGYDAIIPIATPAAQAMVVAAEGKVPVVYAAVSYPETADLTGLENVTGTSDALNTELVMQMMEAMDPDLDKVGLLYSNSEDSSEVPIAEAKAYLDSKNIAYVEKTGSNPTEVLDAVTALVAAGVDAVFTPTDNTVMTQAAHVGEAFADAGILYYAGADTFAMAGGFAACSVDYVQLGATTADITADILGGGAVPEYQTMPGGLVYINTEVAQDLQLDLTPLAALVGDYEEVTTSVTDEG